MSDSIRDTIEEVCAKVFKDMNLTEEQMWATAVRLSEHMMSGRSKIELQKIQDEAKNGVPDDLAQAYHICFLAGYQCGIDDTRRK